MAELAGWGLLLGFLGTAFPFFCFNYGIPKIGSGLAALLGSMELLQRLSPHSYSWASLLRYGRERGSP